MNILVVGAGAVGMLFGAYLAKDNHVTYLTRRAEQAFALREYGCVLEREKGGPIEYFPEAYSWDSHPSSFEYDLVLITTKQNHLEHVLPLIEKNIPQRIPLLFVLNGLGHVELITNTLSHANLYTGITQRGSFKQSDRSVRENGDGGLVLGPIERPVPHEDHQAQALFHPGICLFADHLEKQGVKLTLTEQIHQEMLKKCVVNACINPLTALFQVTNGELVANERLQDMMQQLFQEVANLLLLVDPEFSQEFNKEDKLWEEILKVCRSTSNNKSSMLQDIEEGRTTEIQAITGYFLSMASKQGIRMPYHQMLYEAIQIKESL